MPISTPAPKRIVVGKPGIVGRVASAARARPVAAAAVGLGAAVAGVAAARFAKRAIGSLVGKGGRKSTVGRLRAQLTRIKLRTAVIVAKRKLQREQMRVV